jgi:hypothetical protein
MLDAPLLAVDDPFASCAVRTRAHRLHGVLGRMTHAPASSTSTAPTIVRSAIPDMRPSSARNA